jgi:hypothetical protein
MFQSLQSPHAFALAQAVLTAVLVYYYTKTVETNTEVINKTFFKTLAIATISGLVLAWLVYRPEQTLTEPFYDS